MKKIQTFEIQFITYSNRSKKLIFKDSIEKEISTICTFGSMESFEFVNGSFKVKLQSGVVKLSLLTYVIFLFRYVDILQTLFQNKRGSIHLQKWISANCQPGILINTFLYTFDSQCLKYCICLCFVSDGRFLFFSISSISANS